MNQLPNMQTFNDFLEHYGVKGMKWGVRKSAYATAHDDYKTSPKDKVVALDDISVEENNELASIARSVKTFMSDEYRMLSENSEWIVEDFLEKNKKGLQDPKRQEKLINQLQREVEKDLERFAQDAIDNEFPGTNHKAKVDLSDNWCTVTVGTEKWYKEQIESQLKHADDYEAVSFKFELKRSDGTPLIPKNIVSVSHSDMIVDEFLEHYGVLGMKWGVRKDESGNTIEALASIKIPGRSKSDFDALIKTAHPKSRSAKRTFKDIEKITFQLQKDLYKSDAGTNHILDTKIKYMDADFSNDKVYDNYLREVSEGLTKVAKSFTPDGLMSKVTYDFSATDTRLVLLVGTPKAFEELVHENSQDEIFKVPLPIVLDENRFIVSFGKIDDVEHSNVVGDFLEHYGVKGMKWGERKDPELTELDAMLADLMAVNNSNYGPFAYMLAGMDQKKKMQWLQKNFTQMSGKGKESLAKYNSVLHNVNEYMTKNKIVNRPSDPKEQKVWAEKRKKDLAASHAEFLERKQKGQNLINPNVEISARKEVRSDGSVRLSTKPRIDEIVKPKSKKGDPVIPKNPHFPMPIKHSEVVGDFLEHYGVLGMKWGVRKDRPNSRLPKHATFYNTDKATGATTMVDYNPRKVQVSRVAGGGIQVTGRSRKEVQRVSEEIRRQLSNKSEKKSVTSKLNLTDDELRSTINRMQLEKTYAQLTASPKQTNAAQQFMINTGSQILANAITNVGTDYLKQFLKVNIDKNIKPEFRISKVKNDKK